MLQFTPGQSLLLVLLGLCLLLAGAVGALAARVLRLSRLVGAIVQGADGDRAAAKERSLADLERRVSRLGGDLAALQGMTATAIRHVGVVRYNAFRDLGGLMSFSLALLNGEHNGVVLSILNDREGSRGYAKAVQQGRSASPLSEEEQEALAQALGMVRAR